MSDQVLWFATGGAGIVSLLLLTGVVLLGVLSAGRWQRPGWPRPLTGGLHRNVALLALVFLGVHIATAVIDPFTSLGLAAAAIPFASSYRPFWVGLGVVAVYLGIALVLTSELRRHIGARAWRAVHWAAYAAWPLAVLHGIGAGTDAATPWMLAIDAACMAAVVGAVTWRVLVRRAERAGPVGVAGGRRGARTHTPVEAG
jgi:methionine sulfoxide reductase heme-binding subunit